MFEKYDMLIPQGVIFNLKEIEIHNSKKENERKSVLHFDLTKDNIFICKDKLCIKLSNLSFVSFEFSLAFKAFIFSVLYM